MVFGNPYIAGNIPDAESIVCLYGARTDEGSRGSRRSSGDPVHGQLPVAIPGKYPLEAGWSSPRHSSGRRSRGGGFDPDDLQRVDGVVTAAIADSAFPGAQLAIVRDGCLSLTGRSGI